MPTASRQAAARAAVKSHDSPLTAGFYERLFESLPLPVSIADGSSRAILSVNRAYRDLIGLEDEQIVGSEPPHPWLVVEPRPGDGSASTDGTSPVEGLLRVQHGPLLPVES